MHPFVITGMGCVLPGTENPNPAPTPAQGIYLNSDLSGARCPNLPTTGIIPPLINRRLDRCSRFAWLAARAALLDAGLPVTQLGNRVGMALGTMTGGSEASDAFMTPYLASGVSGASPMLFPNCVAVAISGHLSTAFGITGPSATQLGRENSTLVALEQSLHWLEMEWVDQLLLVGTDALFPLLMEILSRLRLSSRSPEILIGQKKGFLPGEGAQAFVIERPETAMKRNVLAKAKILKLESASSQDSLQDRQEAMIHAASAALKGMQNPKCWISGANGHWMLDEVELPLQEQLKLCDALYPKRAWGEFCGCGGQLLAAAVMNAADRTLITASASSGEQVAMLLGNPKTTNG